MALMLEGLGVIDHGLLTLTKSVMWAITVTLDLIIEVPFTFLLNDVRVGVDWGFLGRWWRTGVALTCVAVKEA